MKRGKPMKRSRIKAKSSKRKQKQALDLSLKAEMLERDGYMCVRCGKGHSLQASHVYPKGRYPSLRHNLNNVLTLCNGCHLFWWHRNPLEAADWFREKWPDRAIILSQLKNL